MHHTLSYVRVSSLFRGQLSAVKCDCSTGVFWIAKGQNRNEVIEKHLEPGDTYTFVEKGNDMSKANTTSGIDLTFEMVPDPLGEYLRVTHRPTGKVWAFIAHHGESDLSLRQRAFACVASHLQSISLKEVGKDPNIEPTDPPTPRLRQAGSVTIGDVQLTIKTMQTGKHLMHVLHMPTQTRMTVWGKPGESAMTLRSRALGMMTRAVALPLGVTHTDPWDEPSTKTVSVNEQELRLEVYSDGAGYPFTKTTLKVTHIPTGISAQRDVYDTLRMPDRPSKTISPTQRRARLECIDEILDKLKERNMQGKEQ